jgi:predicted transcriptional regulator
MKRIVRSLVLAGLGFIMLMAFAGVGQTIGAFSARSGDGLNLNSSDLKGKIIVLFYETKDNKELNREAKDQLNALYDEQNVKTREMIIRLPIIDCSKAAWPFTGIWEDQLIKNSGKSGFTVYGDWDGSVKALFSFADKEAYVLIIDQKGIIRFSEKGLLNQTKIDKAKEILVSLTGSPE